MRSAPIAAALSALTVVAQNAPCDLTGAWVDRSGNLASINVHADGSIDAISFAPTSWRTARGHAASDGSSLWIDFARGNQTGMLVTNCSLINWANGSSFWSAAGPSTSPTVTEVHIVSMAHLDLGYTDLARGVCDEYFNSILPANIALAQQLRGSATPFAYTTHPFLVAEFLDGAAGCAHARPGPAAIEAMREAIAAGDIRWHAQSAMHFMEALSPGAFDAMLGEADRLNAAFNTSWGSQFLKSTDIAGMSRSVVPLLAAAGRRALHIGTNAKCTMAWVPQAFVWAHPESGSSVLALASNDYGGVFVVPPRALFIQYQGDNSGPPSASDVAGFYSSMASHFPNASGNIFYSSLDNFTAAVLGDAPSVDGLPVISSEIGDAWLYGAPSDPVKMGVFRETQRAIDDAVGGAMPGVSLKRDNPNLLAYQRRILVGGPEHNGGVSIGAYLPDSRGTQGNWSNELFHAVQNRPDYAFVASSWAEKRAFLQPLPPVDPSDQEWAAFLQARQARVAPLLQPAPPDVGPGSGYVQVADPSALVTCGRLTAAFNATDGSLSSLVDIATGHQWATPGGASPLLGFVYRTYAESDFDAFNAEFTPNCGVPCPNFGKVGMSSAAPESREWAPTLAALFLRQVAPGGPCAFAARLAMDPVTVSTYGGARAVWLEVEVDSEPASKSPQLGVRLSWFNKTATRLAEASWLSFVPNVYTSAAAAAGGLAAQATDGSATGLAAASSSGRWWLDVLGSRVWPDDVVSFGTRHVHGVNGGFGFDGGIPSGSGRHTASNPGTEGGHSASPLRTAAGTPVRGFNVTSLDALLVSPGDRGHLLHFDGQALPDTGGGMHVVLAANLWGTAFAQWFDGDAQFRFAVSLAVA